ncbi:MAG: patatin-like phospholipase family protein [Deltaproteobacteria bacterium]|nr:patatin-like phospholipase family protein [Deltaproteobacteria bacterium]
MVFRVIIATKELRRSGLLLILACTGALMLLQGCMALQVRHPLPEHLADQAEIADLPGIRAWGDALSESLEKSAIESIHQEMAANHGKLEPEANFLALSGGGGDGAFGAGILCGWTEAGNRPSFKLVTGISTGALIAPFAFLGPEYDARLKEAYTTISDKDIYKVPSILKLLINLGRIEGVGSTEPLAKLLERLVDDKMIQEIAVEYHKGRRLLVGTTQLDAQRQVIWNMGAIAASSHPDRFKLFRQVLRASASIPVAFSPVYIKVQAGGQEYDEMHVDGGVRAEVMLYEAALNLFTTRKKIKVPIPDRPRKLYIIRNAQVSPEYEVIKPKISKIGARAISSLTKFQGVGDLYRIYVLTQRDGIDYNLAYIPEDFHPKRTSEFDTKYMNEEFNLAYNLARKGYKWHKYPPGFEPGEAREPTPVRRH